MGNANRLFGGFKVLIAKRRDGIVECDVATGKSVHETKLGQERCRILCYSPNRKQVVTSWIEYDQDEQNDMTRIAVTSLETGETRLLATWAFREEYGFPAGAALSPDGRKLMLDTRDGVGFWDMETGELLHEQQLIGSDHRSLQFSSDGETIVAASSRTGPSISHWKAETLEFELPIERRQAAVAALSPDERFLVAAGEEFVRVYDFESRELLRELRQGRGGRVHSDSNPSFTPDSRLVAIPINAVRSTDGQTLGED